jgi:penicillin-insensitive murein endopeptidase
MDRAVVGILIALLLAVSLPASGGERVRRSEGPPARSLGSPTAGRLENGVELRSSNTVNLRRCEGPRWGLPTLVGLLERSAGRVARRHPGSVLVVGDLSARGGGELGGHRSHQSGRDADVGFYFLDARKRPVVPERFLRVRRDGRAIDRPDLRFDDARNWTLVESWMIDPRAIIQHVFVAEPLRERLLSHAKRARAYGPVLHRASLALKQPRQGLSHDDHFHVRVACPRVQSDDACVAEPEAEPAAAQEPRPSGRRRSRAAG